MLPLTTASWAEPAMLSADQLMRLSDDGHCYELVQGRLVEMSPTGWRHGSIAANLLVAVRAFVDAHNLGRVAPPETGFDLTQPGEATTVLGADLAFVRSERVPVPGSEDYDKFPHLAPDLVVEIASPSQYQPEMADKAHVWLAAGVRLLWVVWPATHRVDVWLPGSDAPSETWDDTAVLDGRDVLPGFTLPIARLFN